MRNSTKKASLGFKYLSLESEMRLPDEKAIEGAVEDKALNSHQKAKLSKLRCYHKHADEYNAKKRARAGSVSGRYNEARRQALKLGIGWDFTQNDWIQRWLEAGWVTIPGSQSAKNPEGVSVPAYSLRGKNRYNSACMVRVDYAKPWSYENSRVVFRGEDLVPGSKWYRPAPQEVEPTDGPAIR